MRLRLTEFRPRTGPHTHRVVRPRTALRHTSLTAPDPIGLLLGDHDGLNALAALFSFASRSPHTIVRAVLVEGRLHLLPVHAAMRAEPVVLSGDDCARELW